MLHQSTNISSPNQWGHWKTPKPQLETFIMLLSKTKGSIYKNNDLT